MNDSISDALWRRGDREPYSLRKHVRTKATVVAREVTCEDDFGVLGVNDMGGIFRPSSMTLKLGHSTLNSSS